MRWLPGALDWLDWLAATIASLDRSSATWKSRTVGSHAMQVGGIDRTPGSAVPVFFGVGRSQFEGVLGGT